MAEKQAKKKEITEFKNFPEFLAQYQAKKSLPQVFIYVSTDSFEFDLVTETYRNELTTSGEPLEVVVYVAESGDFEKLFSEMFNFSMFSSQKLLIIRSGADFFKSILTAGKKEMYDSFRRNIPNLAEKVYVLLHYDSKDIPAKLSNLFDNRFALLKNRNFYADERRPALEGILKTEKVHLEDAARDEFIHRIQPNTGAYIKAIRKLKLMLNKKEFTLPDIEEVLFNRAEFNPFQLVDLLFSNNKHEFFREFSKFKPGPESTFVYLSLLTALLNRADEVRKAKILLKRFRDENDAEFFKYLGMSSYSDGRKKFTKGRLRRETRLFTKPALDFLYALVLDLNIKAKSSSIKDEGNFYIMREFDKLFAILSSS